MSDTAVWIRTEPVPGGDYIAILEVDGFGGTILDRTTALRYAYGLLQAAATAEYEALVVAQMLEKEVGTTDVAEFIAALRQHRPASVSLPPLTFVPGVSQSTREGFLRVDIDGQQAGQWSLEEARDNALGLLEAHAVAILDSAYYRTLTEVVGVKPDVARAAITDLARLRT